MLEAIELIQGWAAEGKAVFTEDVRTQWAILRGMHTLTESATRLSNELKVRNPSIQWGEMAGYRTIVVHGYLDEHSLDLAWQYIESDLPALKTMVEKELAVK